MTEAEKRVKAISLYDNWCENDTEDTLEIYCYEQGRADVINEIYVKFLNEDEESILQWVQDNITD